MSKLEIQDLSTGKHSSYQVKNVSVNRDIMPITMMGSNISFSIFGRPSVKLEIEDGFIEMDMHLMSMIAETYNLYMEEIDE